MAETALLNIDEGSSSEEEDELIVPQTDVQLARAAAVNYISNCVWILGFHG